MFFKRAKQGKIMRQPLAESEARIDPDLLHTGRDGGAGRGPR